MGVWRFIQAINWLKSYAKLSIVAYGYVRRDAFLEVLVTF